MTGFFPALILLLFSCLLSGAGLDEDRLLVIEDFEAAQAAGPGGSVAISSSAGSALEASAEELLAYSGRQSLKMSFTVKPGGYAWLAKDIDLSAANAGWQVAEEIDWTQYTGIAFHMFGRGTKKTLAFDLQDTGGEIWRCLVKDESRGWSRKVCGFREFFCRTDWQPEDAAKNGRMDFPLLNFRFAPLPPYKGILYIDTVELIPRSGALWEEE